MSDKVTYSEIIEALSRKTGFSKNKSEAFAKALIAQVKEELQENGKASITNFGSFKVKEVAERQGQNPQTGEPITIPAHKRVSFTPYKALREKVNAKYSHLETELIGEGDKDQPEEPAKEVPTEETADKRIDFTSKKRQKRSNNLPLLIIGVLIIAVLAIASAWFLMNMEEEQVASSDAQTQQTETMDDSQAEGEAEAEMSGNATVDESEEEAETSDDGRSSAQQATTKDDDSMETYVVKPDEWYWRISRNVYGKSHFWPLIFQQNFSVDHHPDSLEKNLELAVPALEGTADQPTKQDYRHLSEAATMVSEAYQNVGRSDKAEEYARFAKRWDKASQQ